MIKYLYLLSIIALPFLSNAQQTELPHLTANTQHYLHIQQSNPQTYQDGFIYKTINGKLHLSALVKVGNSSQASASLKQLGISIGSRAGDIWTVQVPVEKVKDFTEAKGIAVIQLDEPVWPSMTAAKKTTRVDSVHAGINLPKPFTGKGVIVGMIDFGYDYNHPTFYDTTGYKMRILKAWELGTNGTPPVGYNYGHELKDTNMVKLQGTDNPAQNHGTSTAGIAAGSGVARADAGTAFRGMAYQADMIMVSVRRDSIEKQWRSGGFSDFVDGITYIFQEATALNRPCVINISWGSQSGSHDGTSLFNQACDNLTGAGKIIVMSAGNEGREQIHLTQTFTPTDTVLKTILSYSRPDYQRTWVDVWGEAGNSMCGQVNLLDATGTVMASTGYTCSSISAPLSKILVDAAGDTCFVEYVVEKPFANNKPRLLISVWNKTSLTAAVNINGTGKVELWNEYYYYGYKFGYQSSFAANLPGYTAGNTKSTVSDMGSAQSVLLVGSYNSKIRWTDINGVGQSYITYSDSGLRSPFSSIGPMADGRIKPDLCAPGLTLATAKSSYDTNSTPTGSASNNVVYEYTHPISGKKYYYGEFIGTSASGPAASGIVALMLEAKPSLTPQQVKDILFETCLIDRYTGQLPASGDNYFGHGKINAYGALRKLVSSSVSSFTGEKLDCVLFPNPNNGTFILDYSGNANDILAVRITDIAGRIVYTQPWKVDAGVNQLPLSLSNLSKGLFMVTVTGKSGSTTLRLSII